MREHQRRCILPARKTGIWATRTNLESARMSMAAFTQFESLRTNSGRRPRAVREHEILRVAATLQGTDLRRSAEVVRKEAIVWAERRCGGELPQDAWAHRSFEYIAGGRNCLGIRLDNGDADLWAVRIDVPDNGVPGRVWTNEIVVGSLANERPRLSARLLVSTPEDVLDIEPHTPGFVYQAVDRCGLSCGAYELSTRPWQVSSDADADMLIQMLVDPARRLPVFVLTIPEREADRRPLLDADSLARSTLGLSHVVVLPTAYSWALTNQFGKQRAVFGGAVRTYLPGFAEDDSPYRHRLVIADQLATPEGKAQCARWMRWLAASESVRRFTLGDQVLAFAAIRNASSELRQHVLEAEGASESAQLVAARARIEALEKGREDDKLSLEYFASEHARAEERAQTAEDQARASAFRIQQLIDLLDANGQVRTQSVELPASWSELSNWCDVTLAGRVVLTPSARRAIRAPEFEDVQLAARCLLWLAEECWERRRTGGGSSLRDALIEAGVWNAHCGGDQFDLNWQGQRYTADWHIKNGGNTRDPQRCLRIYYFWDPLSQQIVVAEMPAHRRTDAS